MPANKITDTERAAVIGHFVTQKDNSVRAIVAATKLNENRVRTILSQYLDKKTKNAGQKG